MIYNNKFHLKTELFLRTYVETSNVNKLIQGRSK